MMKIGLGHFSIYFLISSCFRKCSTCNYIYFGSMPLPLAPKLAFAFVQAGSDFDYKHSYCSFVIL